MRGGKPERTDEARARILAALQALAEPNRLRIVELLRAGPLTVGEIAERLGFRQPQTSKHLKVLAESGIVTVRAEGNKRVYGLDPAPFMTIEGWLETLRRSMEQRLDNLDDYLRRLQGATRTAEREGEGDA